MWPRGLRHGAKDVGHSDVGRCWAPFGSVGQQSLHALERSREVWADLSFSHVKEERISAETVKACALIGLHMTAEECAPRSDSDSSPGFGDMWRCGCPKSNVWGSNGVEWAGSEDASSLEHHEHNVGNLAIVVVGQNWSSKVISLFQEYREAGREGKKLPRVKGPFIPRNEGYV